MKRSTIEALRVGIETLTERIAAFTARTTARGDVDAAAMNDSLGLLQQALDALDAWLQTSGDVREALGDAVEGLAELLRSASGDVRAARSRWASLADDDEIGDIDAILAR